MTAEKKNRGRFRPLSFTNIVKKEAAKLLLEYGVAYNYSRNKSERILEFDTTDISCEETDDSI